MMQNNVLRRLLAALLAVLTLVSFTALPALAAEDDESDTEAAETAEPTETAAPQAEEAELEVLSIITEDDLLALAADCTLDAWSQDKRVVLEADLDLAGLDFTPIATFGGTFSGNGHTIRGLTITDALSPAGLICTLQPKGRVEDLSVEGTVTPSGDPVSTGGLVGENYGTIENCAFTGTVSGGWATGGLVGENKASGVVRACRTGGTVDGENRTGGLVGCNLGVIEDCENTAYVNIESVDPAIDLSDLDLTFSLDLSTLSQFSTAHVATDTGGVTGYNAGTVAASRNTAAIGYPHIGYNTGGIAGRTSGQLVDCVNTGAVNGRKDVGGVAGQVEPYIEMQLDDQKAPDPAERAERPRRQGRIRRGGQRGRRRLPAEHALRLRRHRRRRGGQHPRQCRRQGKRHRLRQCHRRRILQLHHHRHARRHHGLRHARRGRKHRRHAEG